MTIRNEVQIAIRLKQSDGYRYEECIDNGPGGPLSYTRLTLDTAKKQLSLYTKDSEPTIVTRKVIINEGPWEEVETSEVKLLAEILHGKQCHLNHCQCGWNYKKSSTRTVFEERAKKILEKTNFEAAKELIEML